MRLTVAAVVSLLPFLVRAQSPVLLNINNSTYPSTCSAANYREVGVAGLSGSEPISEFAPAFNVALTSPMTFSGGQLMYLNSTANGGTWVKATGTGSTNGLMDCYFYSTTTAPRIFTISNLNLTPNTDYTLYLVGTIPVSDATEDGRFQPQNTPNITFASVASGHGVVGFPFTTSASYSNANTLQFTWAKSSSGNGTFQGLAIVPDASVPAQNLTIASGVQKYAALTNTTVTMSNRCELWITSPLCPLSGCTINLNSPDAWLFLPGVQPALVVTPTYLSQVRINGAAALADTNCRVVQYGDNGTIVIPQPSTFQPLTVFSQPQFGGTSRSYSQWVYYTGIGNANISSFKLKRGYQVVFAQSANGVSYSRCYTAQDGDLEVGVLPTTLDKQVQFIYVTPWRWVSKKGSCDISPTDLHAQWWYNWNISDSSIRDREYVAIRQQPYWPGLNQNWRALQVNHVSGYNEPNNPVEDAYKNLNPPGSVSDAVARLPDQLATGLRVGAPAVTDGGYSWIVDFVNRADAAGYRLDYVPVHYYRSYPNNDNAAGAAGNLYNYLKSIHDAVKRPIWVTEFNNGANWTTDADPTFAQNKNIIEAMINMMDSTPWIERYSIYSAVEEVRQVYYIAGGYTPMGLMYRDHVAPLAYTQEMPDNGTRGIAQYLFGTNTWDTSGYYNNAMAVGAPVYTTGHNSQSQAIVLDGTNSYVQLPANIAKGSAFTFAAWVYWNGGASWQRIFDFGNDTTQYLFLTPSSGSGTLRFAIKNGGSEQIVERATALASGSWQHVAITLNGNTAILYVNGSPVASSTSFSIAPSAFSPAKNYLGKSQWPDPLFNGKLGDVEIADYAMTPAQIATLYSSGPNPSYVSGVWAGDADGNWGTGNNWSGDLIANGVGRMADFSTINITADRTVTLDSARTTGGLRFGDTSGLQNWSLSGANTLTLDGGGANAPTISVNQNTATITAPLAGNNGFAKSGDGTLTLNGANAVGGGLTISAGTVDVVGGTTTFGSGTSSIGYLTGSGALAVTGGSLRLGGELRVGGSDRSGTQYNATGTVTLSNASLSVGALTVARGNYLDNSISGTVTVNSGSTLISTNDVVIEFAGTGLGKLAINGGTCIIGPTATKWFMIGYWDTGAGQLDITGGNLLLENGSSLKMCRSGNTGGNVVNQSGGNVTFYSDAGATVGGNGNLDLNYAGGASSSSTYNLNGGTLTTPQIFATSSTGNSTFNFNGGTLKPTASSTTFMHGLTAANVKVSGAFIDTAGKNITIAQALLNGDGLGGGLTKNGSGTLTLTAGNTYTGGTTVNSGSLVLSGSGSIASSPKITVKAGASLNTSGLPSTFTLGANQTLSGGGNVIGAANIIGTVAPGTSIGTLTFAAPPTLSGNLLFEIDRSHVPTSDKIVVGSGTLNFGGALTVTNIGAALQVGDSFQLLSAPGVTGAFAATNLPALDAGLAWNFDSSSGVLSVVQTVATNPTNVSYSLVGDQIQIAWPADHTGWRLQSQTNGLSPTNWFDVPDSTATNRLNIPLDVNQGSVFYRMVYP